MSSHYSKYSSKKKFSKELIEYLGINDQPYYLTYIYSVFFDKIKNKRSYNSYKLDETEKQLLCLDYGSYIRSSMIKKMIKQHHVKYIEIPQEIHHFNSNFKGVNVLEICI